MGRAYNLTFICSCLVLTNLFASLNANVVAENRGNLNPKLKRCGNGKNQSLVEFDWAKAEILWYMNPLVRSHKPAPAVIKNQGHGIMVEWEGDAGGVIINDTEYKLRQGHWHTPSKHIINGKRFAMEMHLVHTNSIGQTVVIGFLHNLGNPDPFLAEILNATRSVKVEDIHAGKIDPRKIPMEENESYYSYYGSLDVPPCTEGVLWNVLEYQTREPNMTRTVSQSQIRALRNAAVHDDFETNARPQSWKGKPYYLWKNFMAPPDLAPPPPGVSNL